MRMLAIVAVVIAIGAAAYFAAIANDDEITHATQAPADQVLTENETDEVNPTPVPADPEEPQTLVNTPAAADVTLFDDETAQMNSDSPAAAASEEATDAATVAARDGEAPADAARDDALVAAVEEGTVGAFTLEEFDAEVVRQTLMEADIAEPVREDYLAALENPDLLNEQELENLLLRLRAELNIDTVTVE